MRTERARRSAGRVLAVGAAVLVGMAGTLFAARLLPSDDLPARSDSVAMLSAFTDFAAPGSVVAAGLALAALASRATRRRTVLVAVCLATSTVQLVVLAPRWTSAAAPPHPASFVVLALNSRLGLADPTDLMAAAGAADVVVLTEVNATQVADLDRLGFAGRFPYRSAGTLPRDRGAGTAVFARFPVTSTHRLSSRLRNQSWITTLEVPGSRTPVTVVAVHPARPHLGKHRWLGEQDALRRALPRSGPRLVAGDFNAVASQPTQRALTREGWISAVDQTGAGWVPTYPADDARLPPLLDLDHVYVAGGLQATALRSVRVRGTDHLGLLVTVAVTAVG